MPTAEEPGDEEKSNTTLERNAQRQSDAVKEAVGKARDLLIDAGVDVCIISCSFQTEDGCTRTSTRGFGNWHAQNGLIQYLHIRRKEAAAVDEHIENSTIISEEE